MRSESLAEIRRLTLFSGMEEENFNDLMQLAYFQSFPSRVELIREGEPADFLHIVTRGCVELHANSNNRQTTMALVRPVSTFILAAVLKDARYLMSARTTQTSQVLMVPSEHIRSMFEADSAFSRSMVLELATSYRGVVKSLKNHKLRSGTERLANHLLSQRPGPDNGESLTLDIDKKTLASLLGMTPENLSRAFAALRSYGVQVQGRTILIENAGELQAFARPSPLIDEDHP